RPYEAPKSSWYNNCETFNGRCMMKTRMTTGQKFTANVGGKKLTTPGNSIHNCLLRGETENI
ncbi:MAG: hypothetical protein KAX38_07575, partial [Candidatus Krumholzibacteria bacterium]|nr:hypothetical protein [Candidatus Krumholzibacteria bacterium]